MLGLAPIVVLAADFALPAIALLFLPIFAVHRGGREAIAKEHQALHDALTGLPNRELFRDRIDQAVRAGRRNGETAVVMIMDLDHFKEINDTLGHHMGDLLLQEVVAPAAGARCATPTRSPASAATSSASCSRASTARRTRPRSPSNLLMHLREPFVLEGMRLEIDAIDRPRAVPACTARTTRRCSSAPTSRCTRPSSPAAATRIFEPELDRHSPRRLALAGGLRSAINEGQIQLYYQPKADLRTGRIMGAEALARWDHPEFGIVGPSEFVPIAEQTGLITPLTSFVLDAAIAPGARVEGRRPGALGRRQPLRPLVPGHAARGRDPAPARPLGRRGRAARARDHREHAHDRPGPRRGDARRA